MLAWWIDTYASPPPQHGSDCYMVTRVVGPFCYFTKQAFPRTAPSSVSSSLRYSSDSELAPLAAISERFCVRRDVKKSVLEKRHREHTPSTKDASGL